MFHIIGLHVRDAAKESSDFGDVLEKGGRRNSSVQIGSPRQAFLKWIVLQRGPNWYKQKMLYKLAQHIQFRSSY